MRHPVTFLLLMVSVAAACVGTQARIPIASDADARRGAERFPGLTAAELRDGRTLFTSKCGVCHLPPTPGSKRADVWPGEIAEMKTRAHLDEREAALIERYLVTMASAPPSSLRASR